MVAQLQKPTRIKRAQHQTDFFVCLRAVPQNKELSYEAVGMLSYLLSKPNTWEIIIQDLIRDSAKEHKVRRILKELRQAGHVRLERSIDAITKKNIEFFYTIHEIPLPKDQRELLTHEIEGGKPFVEKPQVENPLNGSATSGKPPPLDNKESLESSEKREDENDSSSAFKLYEQNIGIITPIIAEEIKSALKDYPDGWFVDAVKLAVTRGKRSMGYVLGIMKRWNTDGKDDGKSPKTPNGNYHQPPPTPHYYKEFQYDD